MQEAHLLAVQSSDHLALAFLLLESNLSVALSLHIGQLEAAGSVYQLKVIYDTYYTYIHTYIQNSNFITIIYTHISFHSHLLTW